MVDVDVLMATVVPSPCSSAILDLALVFRIESPSTAGYNRGLVQLTTVVMVLYTLKNVMSI